MNEKKLLKKIEDEISLTEDKIKKSEQQKRLEKKFEKFMKSVSNQLTNQ